MDSELKDISHEIVIIKAEENGVTISPVAHEDAQIESPVRLDEGELFIMILNSGLRGYKLRGQVELQTRLGTIKGHSNLIVESGQ